MWLSTGPEHFLLHLWPLPLDGSERARAKVNALLTVAWRHGAGVEVAGAAA
jgi:hypothetical protein